MKVVTIIQARTSSSRLRNKVLFNIDGKTLLGKVIESAKAIKKSDEIWVATSTNNEDNVIEFICKENNVNCFRGSLNDVRSRFDLISKKTFPLTRMNKRFILANFNEKTDHKSNKQLND